LDEPEFLKELHQLRQNYGELLAKLAVAQVNFVANCRVALSPEEYHKMVHGLFELATTGSSGPTLPANLTRQLEGIRQMNLKLKPYFDSLEQLAYRWKLRASWAGPMLYIYEIYDLLEAIGVPQTIDVPLEQLDSLYPWPPPLPSLEISVSAWAFIFYGRKQIQAEVARKLRDYEGRLKAVGLKENPSALKIHARWWFEHHVKGKTYSELEQQYLRVGQETIKRKVWEFSRLAGIRTR
jgi:hypothetical protein